MNVATVVGIAISCSRISNSVRLNLRGMLPKQPSFNLLSFRQQQHSRMNSKYDPRETPGSWARLIGTQNLKVDHGHLMHRFLLASLGIDEICTFTGT